MREYNYDYDMAVVHALYRYGSIGRRRLKKIIESKEYLDKNISFDTFYYHIKIYYLVFCVLSIKAPTRHLTNIQEFL